jgi:hypothetical protein
MSPADWNREIAWLRARGARLEAGLSEQDLLQVERVHGFRFPPDLRDLLSTVLPAGPRFPDWRHPESNELRQQLAWPFDGIAFDIEHDSFWWNEWGPRPSELPNALSVARAAVALAPRLIPIHGHRYLPAEPDLPGNPVFSVYQTDIIYYGSNLRRYLACEFGDLEWAEATSKTHRRIRFWTDLVDAD